MFLLIDIRETDFKVRRKAMKTRFISLYFSARSASVSSKVIKKILYGERCKKKKKTYMSKLFSFRLERDFCKHCVVLLKILRSFKRVSRRKEAEMS